jgi:serine/threonine protein kinase
MSSVAFSTSAGTPSFMAPGLFVVVERICLFLTMFLLELFSGSACSERIDIYAFGVVLNELMTRDWAFAEFEEEEIKTRVLKEQRPEMAEWCPDELNKLIAKCWAQDASKRPSAANVVTLIKVRNKRRRKFQRKVNCCKQGSSARYLARAPECKLKALETRTQN